MADFIAVIRRAVDGLSDNTPEMRIRVYDRARSAVQRQLDNMKPRPADDVIARQLEKLDEAIATIESEFSGVPAASAAPPEPEPVEEVAPPPPPPAPPEPEPTPEPEPLAAPEPEPAPRYVAPEPIAPAPVTYEPPSFLKREPQPVAAERSEPKPEPKFEPAPQPAFLETAAEEPDEAPSLSEDDTMPPPAAEPETSWQRERFDEPLGQREPTRPLERTWDPLSEPLGRETAASPEARFGFEPAPTARAPEPAAEPWTPVVTDNPFHEPAEIFTPVVTGEPTPRGDDRFAAETPKPAKEPKSWWDEVEAAPPPPMPSALPSSSARDASWDSFEAFVGERSTGKANDGSPTKPPRGRDGMSIGQQEPTFRDAAKEPVLQEEREGRGKLIAGILAAVILLAGAGYAGWRFSDSILGLVNGSSSTSNQTASKSQPPAAGQQPPATATKPAGNTGTPTPAATPAATGPQKFTQRLMADGSEVDSGSSGEQVASAAQAEGKSVANQNEKPPAQPTPTQTPAQPTPTPAATSQPSPATSAQATPVKMFLYEERLGQASPTALEGTVTWSVKPDDQDGQKGKMIQGDISVPGRKMSAIFALRKNNDPTLPASHIIELTFSLPKEFEGRGIESVLRISMKDKEQEQGDALVAVPAKITDYFHMVALNSFADAVKTNLNLLKSRDWMDIPVTYSNGRRALLTLQKGPDGQKVFDEVISSWQASGDSAAPAPATAPAQ